MANKTGGLPGLSGTEHIGVTVPDLDQAVEFFVEVLGCQLFSHLAPSRRQRLDGVHLGVHPRAVVKRCAICAAPIAPTSTCSIRGSHPERKHPKNSDIGAYHLGFYVETSMQPSLSEGQGRRGSGRAHDHDLATERRHPLVYSGPPRPAAGADQLARRPGLRGRIQDRLWHPEIPAPLTAAGRAV